MTILDDIFVKRKSAVKINDNNQFIYEVSIHCSFKNYFCVANSEMYVSDIEIKNIVKRFKIDNNITIVCELYSAPLWWLIEEGYVKYVKPIKKVKIKSSKNELSSV